MIPRIWPDGKPLEVGSGTVRNRCQSWMWNRVGSKLKWIDRNTYLAIRRLLDGEINFL
jgi:hypothetical protein